MTKRIIYLAASFFAAAVCLGVSSAHAAATLYFETPTGTVQAGTPFIVRALIDTDQPMNAFDIMVRFAGPVSLVQANNAHSIITIWQSNPTAKDGRIEIAGGSIPAFQGKGGELMTFYVVGTAAGSATLSFENSAAYLADGKGTKFVPATKVATLAVAGGNGEGTMPSATSVAEIFASQPATVPSITFLNIVRDPSGQKILSFLATDNGSGVQGTFMRYRTLLWWSPWQAVVNSAPVPENAWAVDFRAVNNAGGANERTLYDWQAFGVVAGEVVGALVILLLAAFLLLRKRRSTAMPNI